MLDTAPQAKIWPAGAGRLCPPEGNEALHFVHRFTQGAGAFQAEGGRALSAFPPSTSLRKADSG